MGAAKETEEFGELDHLPEDAVSGMLLAEELLRAGDLIRATEAYVYTAGILAARGQVLEAVGVGYRALQLEPRAFAALVDSKVLDPLGEAAVPLLCKALDGFETHRRWRDAAKVGRKLLDVRRDNIDLRLRVSNALAELGETGEALDLLWEAVPPLERDGNNAVLLELLPRVLELDPQHHGAMRRLIRVYLRVGELGACLRTAVPLIREDDPDGLEVLARAQTELGRDDLALRVLERVGFLLVEGGQLERADRLLAGAGRWSLDDGEFRPRVSALREDLSEGRLDRATAMDDAPIAAALDVPVIEIELGIGAAEVRETPKP